MRFAYVDEEGRVLSAHNDYTVTVIPDGAVPLDEVQFDDRFSLRWSGSGWLLDEVSASVDLTPSTDKSALK